MRHAVLADEARAQRGLAGNEHHGALQREAVPAMARRVAAEAALRRVRTPGFVAAHNGLPPDAKACLNFRIHPRDPVQGVVDLVREAIADFFHTLIRSV